jgi:hemerythrin-like domain-containing protein
VRVWVRVRVRVRVRDARKERPMMDMIDESASRREFIRVTAVTAATGGGLLILARAGEARAAEDQGEGKDGKKGEGKAGDKAEDVSPPEDLMREHGVLKRVMLVYDEYLRRMGAGEELPPEPLAQAAGIIRGFVEDYHEKLEEDFLFPRFEKANKLVDLVKVLRDQHQAGRRVTDVIARRANANSLRDSGERETVARAIRQFNRMYAPHEAREDTVLFPAFRGIVSAHEFDALGEDFEKKENELFGQDGFEKMVDKVAGIEKALGIYDLSQFTPKG